ncbi:hypothetical protein FOA52_003944 [Chlamydomonas sp. UWO 241]|nr:hypothetical protein FOA52_003944 [Chlamydomonas sp. UWO 241]
MRSLLATPPLGSLAKASQSSAQLGRPLLRVAPPPSRGAISLVRSFPREREERGVEGGAGASADVGNITTHGTRVTTALEAAGLLAKSAETLTWQGHAAEQLLIDTTLQEDSEGMRKTGEGQESQEKALPLMEELKQLARLQLEVSEGIQQSQAAQAAAHAKVLGALAKIADSSADTAAAVQGMKQSQAVSATEAGGHSEATLKELKQLARMQLEAAGELRESLADIMAAVEKLAVSTAEAGRRTSAAVHIEELKQRM